jgi:acyl carrier protein
MDEEAVRALIAAHFGVETGAANDAARFAADLGADSLDVIELTMLIENHLGIAVDDGEGELCTCVGDALRLVRAKAAPSISPLRG